MTAAGPGTSIGRVQTHNAPRAAAQNLRDPKVVAGIWEAARRDVIAEARGAWPTRVRNRGRRPAS